MANMPLVEREIIMDKMVKASRDILETIADMGYIDAVSYTHLDVYKRQDYGNEKNVPCQKEPRTARCRQ